MAFDFLGTFSKSEFDRLITFSEDQLPNVGPRVRALKLAIERLGWVEYEFDDEGDRTNYSIEPVNSVLAKYTRAFEYHGGSLNELQLRSRGDWIYLTKGEWDISDGTPFAGGKPSEGEFRSTGKHYDDAIAGSEVSKVKGWVEPAIKRRREDLEYRIKRTIDRVDQHIEEIVLLIKRSTGAETLAELKSNIEYFVEHDDFPSVTS